MVACRATLETSELLELIIEQLPPKAIQKVKRVSKIWCHLIEGSKRLRLAGCMKPIDSCMHQISPSRRLKISKIPVYPIATDFQVHKSMQSYYAKHDFATHFKHHMFVPNCPFSYPAEDTSAFATMPPCQAIAVCLKKVHRKGKHTSFRPVDRCTIYVKDGVRVCDMTDVATKMWTQRLDELWDDEIASTAEVMEEREVEPLDVLEGSLDPGEDSGVGNC